MKDNIPPYVMPFKKIEKRTREAMQPLLDIHGQHDEFKLDSLNLGNRLTASVACSIG